MLNALLCQQSSKDDNFMERDCKQLSEVALEVFYSSQPCHLHSRQANQLNPNPALPPLVCSPTNASFY